MERLLVMVCFVPVYRGLSCSGISPPVWPKAYSVRGNISVPMAGINEPFMAHYDETVGNLRIDYWGGVVKTFQSSAKPFGFMRKFSPLPDGSLFIMTCLQKIGTASNPFAPQTIFPDLSKYICADINDIDGVQNQKWVYTRNSHLRTTKFTVWLKIEVKNGHTIPFPVRFEVKDYEKLLESHYDHYFLLYDLFSSDPPGSHVWTVEPGVSCSEFHSADEVRHLSFFDSMQEYVQNMDDYLNDAWEYHINKYKKRYTGVELLARRHYFKQNRRFVFSMNRAGRRFKLKLNHFADWSQKELDALRGRKYWPEGNNASVFPEELLSKEVPKDLNWRLLGMVTPVKDQGMCGSGWAFAATGALEGANYIKTGCLDIMSEQALMDCSWNYGNDGCDGGDDFRAFKWVINNGGVPTSKDYGAYKTDDGLCHVNRMEVHGSIKGYSKVKPNDSPALRATLFHNGPISVALHASAKSFIFYSSGVYSDPACLNSQEDLNHYALLVGYGNLSGKHYWLIKNSWSTSWGKDGYILIDADDNMCGVMTSPTFVIT